MISKSIDQIAEEDLQALVDNAVLEGKTVEYKQSLPGNSDSDKREFLSDVSSFANASGGDLIFGIVEGTNTGTPQSVEGLTIENIDREIMRLDSIMRDGIEPRVLSITIKPINLSNSKVAMLIRIPKSWASPHRVSFKRHDRFYSRSTNGKYPMDVTELRVAFNLSETMAERIRNFRLDRISKIFADDTPVPFYDNPKIVVHLLPIISFNPAQNYDIDEIASQPGKMKPMYCSGWSNRYNLDGLLVYSGGRGQLSHSYVQLFRNGIIEAVEGLLLEPHEGTLLIPSIAYEREMIASLADYLSTLQTLNVEPPIFVFVDMLGVKGYSMSDSGGRFWGRDRHTIDRDALLLPEIIVDSYDVSAEQILRPCFDSIWNACGLPRSLNYNDAGEWAPK